MPDADERRQRALGAYWDAVVLGERPSAEPLEPLLAAAITWTTARDDAPAPDSAFVARLEETLMATPIPTVSVPPLPRHGPSHTPNDRTPGRWLSRSPRPNRDGRRGWVAHLATAALLLLTLIGSFVLFGPGRQRPPTAAPGAIPAVGTTASPQVGEAPVAEFVWKTNGGPGLPLTEPGYLVLAPDGNLWVPDGRHDRFQIFSPDGAFLEAWGTPGSGDGQLALGLNVWTGGAVAFAPDAGFYVLDAGNLRIQRFTSDRAFVVAWGGEGSGPGQFKAPSGIAVGAEGRVYVTDDSRHDLQIFGANGTHLRTIGKQGFRDGEFLFTQGSAIAIDPMGNVWVSDNGNQRLQIFSAEGDLLRILRGGPRDEELAPPRQLAFDASGRVFVAAPDAGQVQMFRADGFYLGALGGTDWVGGGATDVEPGEFLAPIGVAVDGLGNLYVADPYGEQVLKFRLLPAASLPVLGP